MSFLISTNILGIAGIIAGIVFALPFAKNILPNRSYSLVERFLRASANTFFVLGFIFSAISLFFEQSNYNIIVCAIYIVLITLKRASILKNKEKGLILKFDGSPAAFAVLNVYSATAPDVKVFQCTANETGQYYCPVSNDTYIIKIDEKISENSYKTVFTSNPIEVTKELINQTFEI